MYEGITISAFTTVKVKCPKLFQVCEELLMLHVYCWQHYLVYSFMVAVMLTGKTACLNSTNQRLFILSSVFDDVNNCWKKMQVFRQAHYKH